MSASKRRQFQEKLLSEMKATSFVRLMQLPEQNEVHAPKSISDWTFLVRRRSISTDELELAVEARKQFPDGEAMSFVKGFRITRDGKISEDIVTTDD